MASTKAVDVSTVVHVEHGDGSGVLADFVEHSVCADAGCVDAFEFGAQRSVDSRPVTSPGGEGC
jgi:hypothetical protein